MIYTGIGSRKTPHKVLGIMYGIGASLAKRGDTLRSGAADGADSSFESGCDLLNGLKEIYIPWRGFNNKEGIYVSDVTQAKEIASKIHPAWDKCSDGARSLHARNVFQVLGADLLTPTEFVVCWTPKGEDSGGTRTAIVLAKENNIPVYNLAKKEDINELFKNYL